MPEEQQNEAKQSGLGGILGNIKEGAGKLTENVKEGAGKVTDAVKDKVEDVVGEENLKKVTDVLNTDVGALAKDTASNAVNALENLTGKDINQDGTVGGKPKDE